MATVMKLVAMAALTVIGFATAFLSDHSWYFLVAFALLCSWIGDAFLADVPFLARRVKDPFLAGMGAFAVAQILYIIGFWQSLNGMPLLHARVPGQYLGAEVLVAILPCYIMLGLLFWTLTVMRADRTWDLKIATLVYCLLLSTMAGMACSAAFTGVRVAWPLILGGILFMVSDGFIAMRLFRDRFEDERKYQLAVWGTYLPAQILLFLGTSWLY